MKIANLHTMIGLKGGKQVSKDLSAVSQGFGLAKSLAVGLVGALSGAFFAKFASGVAKSVVSLYNFNAQTGLSIKRLQVLTHAAKKAGLPVESLQNSILGVQRTMARRAAGGQAPQGLSYFLTNTGADSARLRDTYYVLTKIANLAKRMDPDMFFLLESMGVQRDFLGAARKGAFDPSKLTMPRRAAIDTKETETFKEIKAIISGLVQFVTLWVKKGWVWAIAKIANYLFGIGGDKKLAPVLQQIYDGFKRLNKSFGTGPLGPFQKIANPFLFQGQGSEQRRGQPINITVNQTNQFTGTDREKVAPELEEGRKGILSSILDTLNVFRDEGN